MQPKPLQAIRLTAPSFKALAEAARASVDGASQESLALESVATSSSDAEAQKVAEIRRALDSAITVADSFERSGRPLPFAWDHGPSSLLQSFLHEVAHENFDDFVRRGVIRDQELGDLEAVFDGRDPGWIGSVASWWRGLLDKHAFLPLPETSLAMPQLKKIAVLGDWGTGLYGAPVCAGTIERQANHELLIHLGDVYYSGMPKEIESRFLDMWPTIPGAVNRAINSNHEMYAGGHGYFEKTLRSFEQSSSCFMIDTDHFALIGLDTGYNEADLGQGQVEWLTKVIERQKKAGRQVVLFSHHAPMSAIEQPSERVVDKLTPLLESRSILAWYWGHEHRMVVYDQHPGWGLHGRLVGHGGFPQFRDDVAGFTRREPNKDGTEWVRLEGGDMSAGLLLDGDNQYVVEAPPKYGPHGYMSLELDGPSIHELVHAADGTVLYEHTINS